MGAEFQAWPDSHCELLNTPCQPIDSLALTFVYCYCFFWNLALPSILRSVMSQFRVKVVKNVECIQSISCSNQINSLRNLNQSCVLAVMRLIVVTSVKNDIFMFEWH